jgi:hypothetical protein
MSNLRRASKRGYDDERGEYFTIVSGKRIYDDARDRAPVARPVAQAPRRAVHLPMPIVRAAPLDTSTMETIMPTAPETPDERYAREWRAADERTRKSFGTEAAFRRYRRDQDAGRVTYHSAKGLHRFAGKP